MKTKTTTQNLILKYASTQGAFATYYDFATDRFICLVHRASDATSASVSASTFGSPAVTTWLLRKRRKPRSRIEKNDGYARNTGQHGPQGSHGHRGQL
jgi:hypothetical protein